ncbi:MAG TPA: FHA domain-containing protein [Myxococcaceae bacterium]|nr:FHA domain-containing protein [Myxococcaceae bacterium]
MKIEIRRHGDSIEVELKEGTLRLGGGDEDGLRVPDLPPELVRLRLEAGLLSIEALSPLRINGVLCPPKVPRLLMPDETLELAEGVTLRPLSGSPPPPPPPSGGTLALLKGFLGTGGAPPPTVATLTCLTGLDLGRVYPLTDGENAIGRGERAAVRIRDRAVSRRHARVVRGPRGYELEELAHPNGVYVNGARLEGPRLLEGGEVLELGQSLLRFTAPPRPAPQPAAQPAAEPFRASPEDARTPVEEPPRAAMGPVRRALRLEWLVVALGIASALLGALVTWGLVH